MHFKAAEDLLLDVIGELFASVSVDRWVEVAKAAGRRCGDAGSVGVRTEMMRDAFFRYLS